MIGRQKLPTENTEEDEEEMTTGVKVDTNDDQSNDNGNDNEDENNFGAVMIIQVPSTATAGSILEVVDPSNLLTLTMSTILSSIHSYHSLNQC